MKFNIGDTVIGNRKATARYGITTEGWTGTVTRVSKQEFDTEIYKGLEYQCFDLLTSAAKIVITSDGKTTLARLYDGDKVTRSAEAKCRPTNTYDFAAGANLAYDRLMRPEALTASVKPQDKPRFKAGDKAKIVSNSSHHYFPIGEIVVLRNSDYDKTWHAEYLDGRDGWYVKECDLEPYAEPDKPAFSWDDFKVGKIAVHCDSGEKAKAFCAEAKATIPNICGAWRDGETNWRLNKENTVYGNDCGLCYGPPESWSGYTIIDYPFSAEPAKAPSKEPVKLYCVKSFESGEWLTRGKIYESTPDFQVTYDDGYVCPAYETIADLHRRNPNTGASLFPLVSRPAKVGEWVLVTNAHTRWERNKYKNGDIRKIVKRGFDWAAFATNDTWSQMMDGEYEVLDGYDGRYEPKEDDLSGYEWVEGVKGMDADMKCLCDFQYELGKTYDLGGEEFPRAKGFHFCRTIDEVKRYSEYHYSTSRYFKVRGLVKKGSVGPVCCARKIEIIEEIKPEPKFYSGKVVCIEAHCPASNSFTAGKVYTFRNGKVADNDGDARPLDDAIETLAGWNKQCGHMAKFIEYKGEST